MLGLSWDRIDFRRGSILINKQLQKEKKAGGAFTLDVYVHVTDLMRDTSAMWMQSNIQRILDRD